MHNHSWIFLSFLCSVQELFKLPCVLLVTIELHKKSSRELKSFRLSCQVVHIHVTLVHMICLITAYLQMCLPRSPCP
ncbi:uncharacterized protein BJ212DRAFT_896486 [Suillus subaureus]|uniref:Uncharacterized protein n=1 Tax=Suillus subaureus TaxID=48587 RepID=A0A9P7DW42_9AGAM|nr:uncharacterized protein BJ212DRAFT_896486 [Suillus subaureus]KAG1804395.1 hypothetical protein BJ212DRAFT_896486 [Suillus subaureus]